MICWLPLPPRKNLRCTLLGWAASCLLCSCQSPSLSSPEDLRNAYLEALSNNDPDQAYALLSPDLQAITDLQDFRNNWQSHTKERATTLQTMQDSGENKGLRSLTAKTWYRGRQLTWRSVNGKFWLANGLPGMPDTSTPQATLRSLVTALRTIDLRPLEHVFAESLRNDLNGSWKSRADEIESALNQRNRLEISESENRAVLHYGAEHSVILLFNGKQWQITRME